jgi:hypothetical protein
VKKICVRRRQQKSAEGSYDEYAIYPRRRAGKTGDYTIRINAPSERG